jgi:hypothetical protein
MKRVYSREDYYETSSETLVNAIKILCEKKKAEGATEQYKMNYKYTCEFVRRDIGTTDVVCLALHKDEKSVLIIPFPVEATDDNFYEINCDDEKQDYYIEVEEGVVVND